MAALSPGADIDHRGTPFTGDLLHQLLNALLDPTTGRRHVGAARFGGAFFSGRAGFGGALYSGGVEFSGATFSDTVMFHGAEFSGLTMFDGATFADAGFGTTSFSTVRFNGASFLGFSNFQGASFSGPVGFADASFFSAATFDGTVFEDTAYFGRALFSKSVGFSRTTFSGPALFEGAAFSGDAHFDRASFSDTTDFGGVVFSGGARFTEAQFASAPLLGPLACTGTVVLDGAVFQQPVRVEIAARQVSCVRTRWVSTAMLQLRHAELDLSDAVFEYPVVVATRPTPGPVPETELSSLEPGVRLTSVSGADAAHLVLQDVDLSVCRFAGAVHLDQMRVDGWCTFATTPTSSWRHRLYLRWWTQRSTLVEEHHWRVQAGRSALAFGWTPPPEDTPVLRPAALAALYRQLRKSLEDAKNEPDAADFYYGEMEMRRHDATRPRAERALLAAYWALSGYGLRATRALIWLLGAMTATLLALMMWGLPADDPKSITTGREVAVGQEITLTTDTPDPANPTGSLAERVTTERCEKALRVVINSVVFRSSGQDLTTAGTYTEMASRLAEPVLLSLAVLAVRSRVKR
ncbi:pentapeptide repeat-containing protein [Streptomyces sp. NPDC006251]|uniref:pentapeptide repeat-containing protein n=1 Tax=Streptomyces sp. NPDC006251 TaxID=3155718 RepID=UPI0033BBA114